ncbi:MAG: Rieske 2Fe-2S domain-containing protein [Planctomycetota bacterium]
MIQSIDRLQPLGTSVSGAFCNPAQTVRSWYVVMPSKKLKRGKIAGVEMLGRRIALWRDTEGNTHAVDAACPHLGADLSLGKVVGDDLRCPFHHWRIGIDGRCVDAPCEKRTPNRSTRAYPIKESHGLIWLYNGPRPTFALPALPSAEEHNSYFRFLIKPLHLKCHPHLAIANGLDATHFDKLHGLSFSSDPIVERIDEYRMRVSFAGRPRSQWIRWVTQTGRNDVEAQFTSFGGSIAWLTFTSPLRFHAVFTARPDANGETDTQTILYLPRGLGVKALRCAATLLCVLHADRAILNSIQFKPGFVASDSAMSDFARQINAMEVE